MSDDKFTKIRDELASQCPATLNNVPMIEGFKAGFDKACELFAAELNQAFAANESANKAIAKYERDRILKDVEMTNLKAQLAAAEAICIKLENAYMREDELIEALEYYALECATDETYQNNIDSGETARAAVEANKAAKDE